ncbi:MAG: T9SS type A sorting domain-containing protein [Ignavibacteria bacterium]|nr:T9SS type A sorting domain-containing protein [Ignavibacteria bacterium]
MTIIPLKSKTYINQLSRLFGLIFAAFILTSGSIYSQWAVSPVCNAEYNQVNPVITTDGKGGAIIAWQDKRSGKFEIYAQRMNSFGNALWTTNGIPICTQDSNLNPTIITDDSGGAIITWESYRGSAAADIFTQRVNSNGEVRWNINGVPVCIENFDQDSVSMVSDGLGGAIFSWQDYRSNNGFADIYAQRINANGVVIWTANGVSVCNQAAAQRGPKLVCDGSGGAIITWFDNRAGNYDIYSQRAGYDGAMLWTTNGVATCTMATDQLKPDICSDEAGGAIITWYDYRSETDYNIYAQRLDPLGGIMWVVDGVVMNNNVAYAQIDPKIVSDGLGGAIISWTDYRTGITADIYAQHVSYSGALLWTATGVTICTAANNQIKSQITSDGKSGAYITWEDYREGNSDIYIQLISSAAALNWSAGGSPICTVENEQLNPMIVSDGNFGSFVVWQDYRNGNNFDINESVFNTITPVHLSSFSAFFKNKNIILNWVTTLEQNNSGFDIERKTKIEKWIKTGFVKGNGTSNSPFNYSFEDRNMQTGEYYYRLKQIDYNGNFEYYNLSGSILVGIPSKFDLSQNYPNPFNPITKINFELPEDTKVNITIFDLTGRIVRTIVNEARTAGYHTVQFDASGISSGVYLYRIITGAGNNFVMTKKLVVLK